MTERDRIELLHVCDDLFVKHISGFQDGNQQQKEAHLDMAVKWATIATHLRLMGAQQ